MYTELNILPSALISVRWRQTKKSSTQPCWNVALRWPRAKTASSEQRAEHSITSATSQVLNVI